MSKLKFCLITPSYRPDFARCRLLAESVERFAVSQVHHYIIVDRRDFQLFQQLANSHRTIVTVESILPWWIDKIPLVKNGWFSWKTLPIRNWLIQQIVKLEIANHLQEDVFLFVDSDVVFVRPFDYRQFIQNGKIRLSRVKIPVNNQTSALLDLGTHLKWQNTATSLIDIPPMKEVSSGNSFISYVGNLITWKKDNVLQLHRQIETVTQQSWIKAIADSWYFSEYMLYGIFVDLILQDNSCHYGDDLPICHDYWGTTPLRQEQLQQFVREIPPESFAVMISAKSKTPVNSYAGLVRNIASPKS